MERFWIVAAEIGLALGVLTTKPAAAWDRPREMLHANLSVWARIILSIALIAGGADRALAQSQSGPDIRSQVEALLGGHENSASPEQWRRLGNAAIPILQSVVADYNALPTRRARSLGGLAALSTGDVTMQRIANSASEPLIVRMSAVRGLAQVLPESDLIPALRPLLNDAQSQMRGITAEALSHTPAGCAEIKDMAQRETDGWRSRFARRCGDQRSSADRSEGGERTTVVDTTSRVVVYKIADPSGNNIFNYASPSTSIAKIFPSRWPGSFSVLLPNSPTVPFTSGQWTFNLLASQQTHANVQAIIKAASNPTLTTGRLNANLFFVGVPGLDAESAPTDPNFQTLLSKVRNIYAQIGVELGDLTYIDITGPDAVRFTDAAEQDLGNLFMLSSHQKARDGAINLFLVHSINGGALSGYIVLGESGGIPGTSIRGTMSSGLAVTTADFPNGLEELAHVLAHEAGHWLGLFHTTEASGTAFDPLPDTPQCPQVPYDTDHNFIMEPQECSTLDATNLMFWSDWPGQPQRLLTPNQQFVILRNPVVSQPPESGVRVRSIQLGLFPVYTDRLGSPITVDVPRNAVSLDFVGVAEFEQATVRVPQDFPTIQLAVDNAFVRDRIRVGPGRWCGARITKTLTLIGEEGATIMGCPAGVPGPIGVAFRRGFRLDPAASGTSISHFVFDGNGFADNNRVPLYVGIEAPFGTNNVVIDSNTFQGGAFGIIVSDGDDYQITHNIFDGFTILSNGIGGAAILDYGASGQVTGHSIVHNQITSTVPSGNLSGLSSDNAADVPLAGIVVSGQKGVTISNNKISITANLNGDGGVGILATDSVSGLPTPNLTVTNNDGRGSAYALIIDKDQNGGTGNSVGAVIGGNLGVNLIDGVTTNVTRRSRRALLVCDPVTGVCPSVLTGVED